MGLRTRSGLVAACAVGVASAASNALADPSTAPEVPTQAQLANLTSAEITLLESGTPVDISLDPTNGDILSVSTAAPDISNRGGTCDAGDGCYLTNKVPYANQGFYGSAGTYYGSWPYRSGYTAGNYTVSACWSTNCGPEISPGSKVTFTSDVTGTSFTIY